MSLSLTIIQASIPGSVTHAYIHDQNWLFNRLCLMDEFTCVHSVIEIQVMYLSSIIQYDGTRTTVNGEIFMGD